MNESKNIGCSKEMFGCIGAIGAALVTGIFMLIIALPTLTSFLAQSTTTPIVVIVTATSPSNAFTSDTPVVVPFVQPTILPVQATLPSQCSHFQVYSAPTTIPVGMWVATRICSPARSACFYTIEQSSGGTYSTYEHNGNDDRRWVNAFCTEAEAKNFANTDAKAMLEWWQYTEQNPFP